MFDKWCSAIVLYKLYFEIELFLNVVDQTKISRFFSGGRVKVGGAIEICHQTLLT